MSTIAKILTLRLKKSQNRTIYFAFQTNKQIVNPRTKKYARAYNKNMLPKKFNKVNIYFSERKGFFLGKCGLSFWNILKIILN